MGGRAERRRRSGAAPPDQATAGGCGPRVARGVIATVEERIGPDRLEHSDLFDDDGHDDRSPRRSAGGCLRRSPSGGWRDRRSGMRAPCLRALAARLQPTDSLPSSSVRRTARRRYSDHSRIRLRPSGKDLRRAQGGCSQRDDVTLAAHPGGLRESGTPRLSSGRRPAHTRSHRLLRGRYSLSRYVSDDGGHPRAGFHRPTRRS
jgi:hypothetical protein